jgi:hypothetical protein
MKKDSSSDIEKEDVIDTLTPNPELDQWKFYAQTTLNTSNRRLKNNRFYIRLLLGLLAAVGAGQKLGLINPVGVLFAGVVGFPMCVLWYFHILSYKQLNSGKYQVLKEMAEDLPYSPFDKEWKILDEGDNPDTYITHTSVEVWWPRVLGYPFAMMVLYGGTKTLDTSGAFMNSAIILTVLWGAYFVSVWSGKPLFGTLSDVFDSKIPYITKYRKRGENKE